MGRVLNIERIPAPFASIYEKATRLVVKTYYARVAEEIVFAFAKGRVLDLGTGPGYLPIEIARRAASVSVVGIDLSRPLITMAREKALDAGLSDRVQFEVGNATKLRFEEESFDRVVSTGMLHMLRDPVKMLVECRRVLKPASLLRLTMSGGKPPSRPWSSGCIGFLFFLLVSIRLTFTAENRSFP
jgi:ubiquinone/menaquinone biosynthesis C-methylase UbiE